jgi:hypothetical protein
MSAPALPLSEHAARATASFARLLAEAEGTNKAQERHIDTSISHDPGTNLHHTTSDECADGDGDGKRRVYSPSFLLQFKEVLAYATFACCYLPPLPQTLSIF